MLSALLKRRKVEYAVVPVDDGEACTQKGSASPPPSNYAQLPLWAIAICLLSTAVNVALLFLPNSQSMTAPRPLSSYTREDIGTLRRPSQFIRLEQVARPSPPIPRSFDLYPVVVANIDSARPDKVYNDDPKRLMSHIGTISFEDRRVLVSSSESTIVQFRAIDYGMETCEVQVVLPPSAWQAKPPTSPDAAVSVYRLNASTPLDTRRLSYRTRPARLFRMADIAVGGGAAAHWRRNVTCASDEVLSFELACGDSGDGDCQVEWWQDREGVDHDAAIFVTQHATI